MRRALTLALLALALVPAGAAAAPQPATFRVGAATESIDPLPGVPVYSGGFGMSPPITRVHDPLQVKAFYVERDGHAVAFAVVDCQAWFAAYQEGDGYGIADARAAAAKAVGPKLPASSIIIQGTHGHATATLEGIWGPVPPAYLKHVHDQAVKAIAEAAAAARPAHLQWGTVDVPYLDNIDTAQTDSYSGWSQDGQLSVLRAVAPGSGETLATYVNVPAHPDIVNGAGLKLLSADYFGAVRAALEERLGGTSVVGGATLGREETPVQTDGLEAMQWFSGVVGELVTRALAHARWITDGTLAATTTPISIPGANPLLLGLVAANHLPDDQKQQFADQSGEYPIDRADTPPYLTGNVIGTDLTAIRIGPLAYLSMPGESFPEVRRAIADATTDAGMVVALAKGQDDLGYFYPAWVYPFTYVYDSDHGQFNVAPQLGDQVIEQHIANLQALGFTADQDVGKPLPTRFEQGLRPGVQAMASPSRGDAGADGTFSPVFEAVFNGAAFGGSDIDGPVHWDFGDGTTADTKQGVRFAHAFEPGSYEVRLSARDAGGKVATWAVPVEVYRSLQAAIVRRGDALVARVRGGRKPVLAYRWSFDAGPDAYGPRVVLPDGAHDATLRVTDATGTVASAQLSPPTRSLRSVRRSRTTR